MRKFWTSISLYTARFDSLTGEPKARETLATTIRKGRDICWGATVYEDKVCVTQDVTPGPGETKTIRLKAPPKRKAVCGET